jgi:hypothetical protein
VAVVPAAGSHGHSLPAWAGKGTAWPCHPRLSPYRETGFLMVLSSGVLYAYIKEGKDEDEK